MLRLIQNARLRLKRRQLEAVHRELLALPAELAARVEAAEQQHVEYLAWLHAESARMEADMKEHSCRLSFEIRRIRDAQRIDTYA